MVTIAELQKKHKIRRRVFLEMRGGAFKNRETLESVGLKPADIVELINVGWMRFNARYGFYRLTESGERMARSYALEDAKERDHA